jgi:membrane protein
MLQPIMLPHWPSSERVAGWRDRALAFARFLGRRFLDDKCFEAAGALSYTTLFALVPLATAAFGILAAFPQFETWSAQVTRFVFANFVPSAAQEVEDYLTRFAGQAKALTGAGIAALIATALIMMASVEETFNRIFRAPARRRRLARFVVYWTVLTLGPILLAASLAATSYLLSLPMIGGADRDYHLSERLLSLLPWVVTWTALTLAYLVIPNANVRWRNAFVGGLVAMVLFELAKQGFAEYLARASFRDVYGSLAVLPIFLFWIWLMWVVVLLGASLASTLSAFRYRPLALRVTRGLEFAYLVQVLAHVVHATRAGTPPSRTELARLEPNLTDMQLDRFLDELRALKLAQRNEFGQWTALRDLAEVPLSELFTHGRYHWPDAGELARLQAQIDARDARLAAFLADGVAAQAALLARPVADVLTEPVPARAGP